MHLILTTYGTYLTVNNGQFLIITKDEKKRISPEKIKSITITSGAQISSNAAILAIENNIDVFFSAKTGKPLGRIWSMKFGSITTIRRKQLDFTLSAQAVDWIRKLIMEKMDNQVALLLTFEPADSKTKNSLNRYINRINDYKQKVKKIKGQNIAEVSKSFRGWEGAASKNYFEAINMFLPQQYRFEKRTRLPAKDIFNAMLNYGYGMLYAKIEAELIKAGIDPYVGVMHREDYNRPVLVFDIIEKYRVWIDFVVVNLAINQAITEDMYKKEKDGSVWLEGLSKRILIQSVNDYFDEKVNTKGKYVARQTLIAQFCTKLAKQFMFFSPVND